MAQDDLEKNSEQHEDTEESGSTGTLEVIETTEEALPEEQPKWADVDHSQLYIWIADSGNDRIQKFDGNGKFLFQFGKSAGTRPPYREGLFKGPFDVAVDKEGNVWVADTGCHRIQKFDSEGDFILAVGTEGWGQEKFYWPEAILAEPGGTILVADTHNHSLKRYDDDGEYLLGFGFPGDFDGFCKFPSGVAVDQEGNIYVADRDNQRVQIFNEDGQFLSKFGEYGFEEGRFNFPCDITVRNDGTLLVVEKSQRLLCYIFNGERF